MYKIGICDDEPRPIEEVAAACRAFFAESGETCEIRTYSHGQALLEEQPAFDILFLDIEMPGLSGIELAREIRRTDTGVKIIYVTNYADFKSHAFTVHAFGYLTKPARREAIEAVLRDAIAYGRQDRDLPVFTARNQEGRHHIPLEDILYFDCRNHTVTLHAKGRDISFTSSMKQLAEELEPLGFAECHRSFLVNLACIRLIKGLTVCLDNGEELPLPQKKAAAFRRLHNHYLQAQAKKL